jgi:signal transduction histidine kinase
MRTIRQRVTVLATLLTAGLLAVVALVMVLVMRRQLTDNLDEGLNQRADTLAAVVTGAVPSELPGDEDLLIQVIAADGTVVASSANLAGRAPIVASSDGGFHTIRIAGRPETFRVLLRAIQRTTGQEFVVVGTNYDHVTEPVNILLRILTASVPAVVVVLGLLVWWLTGRTLRPVERMRSEVAEINERNLGGRIREPATGDEIDRLARTMNDTLGRLEEAVHKQQRFVADASHELRTPLTRMRTELEVDLAQNDTAQNDTSQNDTFRRATERSVLAETIAMQHLVDDLLQIARGDAHGTPLALTTIDLDDVAFREVRRIAERGIVTIDTSEVSAVQVHGDESQIGRALRNVLENAERHARSNVSVALCENGSGVLLTVTDDGAGVEPAERERIFDRFTRLDEARSRSAGGAGLGLAIARDIMIRHGGTITVAESHGACFVLSFPSVIRP